MQMTVGLLLMALAFGNPQAAAPNDDAWAPYRFLLGTWAGEGKGQPGDTSGTATFNFDLDGRVLVRTSRATVPATAQRAGYVHEDRLVVYRDAPGRPARAIYWDNEDHTIEYDVSASPDGKTITFVSRPAASAPRFRLVYTQLATDSVDVKFEMAPPGSPDAFKVYTEGVTKRVARPR
jgi:WD40-like Beta Propeller Repeat